MMKAPSSPVPEGPRPLRPAAIAFAYAAAGALWVLLLDGPAALGGGAASPALHQILPGLLFVAASAAVLFLLLSRARRNQDALRERIEGKAADYRAMFEANPHPMWVYDLETLAFLAVNDAALAHYGWSRQEFLGMTIADIRPAEDVAALKRNVASVTGGLDRAGVWRHRKKNGELIEVEITSGALAFEGRAAEIVLAHDVTAQRAARRQAAEAEERARLALAAARHGLYDLDLATGRARISDDYALMLGYAPGELEETNAAWLARMHPEDRERVERAFRDYVAGGLPEYRVEFRQRTRQGEWKWILSQGKVMARGGDGRPLRMLGTHTDIDADKRAQARIRRLGDLYAALSQCNQAIVRIQERGALLREICRVAVDHGGLRMAWIGEVRDGRIEPVASFGACTHYIDEIGASLDAAEAGGRGPTGRALREDRPVVCDAIESDPDMAPWREAALASGFHASAAFPLRCFGQPVGTLNLYAPQPRFFDDELIGLLDEMAVNISLALERFRLEAERVSAEQRFRLLVDHAADAVFITDQEGRVVDANARACASLGYRREELLAMNIRELDPMAAGLGRDAVREIHAAALKREQLYFGQHRRKDGSTFPVEVRIAGIELPDGPYVIGMARDVSERMRADVERERLLAQAQAARESYQQLIERITDGVVALDRDWRYAFVSDRAASLLGRRREELIGRHIWTEFPEAADGTFHKACEQAMTRQCAISTQEYYPPLGRWFEDNIYPSGDGITVLFRDVTEHKRAAIELAASEARLRTLLELLPYGVQENDVRGVVTYANLALERMNGVASGALVGRSIWDRLAEEAEKTRLRDYLAHLVAHQPAPTPYFCRQRREDGVTVELQVDWTYRRDPGGTLTGFVSVITDITERTRAEAALRAAEAFARATIDALSAHICVIDGAGRIVATNRAWREFAWANGTPPEAVSEGIDYLALCEAATGDDAACARTIAAGVREVLRDGRRPFSLEYPCHSPSEERWFLLRATRFPDDAPPHVVLAHENVTAVRLAERGLRESEARLRRVVDEMPVLLDAFDEEGLLIHWNRECERVTGYSAAEVVGNPGAMALLYPDPAYRERMLGDWQARGNDYRDWEWALTAKDGSIRHVVWSNVSARVAIPGWPVWGVGVDVTARREAEAQLAAHTERLQALSRRLLSVQEEERRALARELHDEIGQQLAALKLNLKVLLRAEPSALDRRRLTDCVDIADQTIERMRDTALNLRPSVLDDLGLASALHWYARRQAERGGLRIEVEAALPPLPAEVETAAFRIVQEAVNNALRHAHAGRIDVVLAIAGAALVLRVEDDGGGFDPAQGRAVAGMGLFGMRERAELLGGRFELDTRPGGGTRIRAAIPLDCEAT